MARLLSLKMFRFLNRDMKADVLLVKSTIFNVQLNVYLIHKLPTPGLLGTNFQSVCWLHEP